MKPNNVSGLYRELTRTDIMSRLMPLIRSGKFVLNERGKIQPIALSIEPQTPWIHVKSCKDRDCGVWHNIMFDIFHILPSPCLNCWKVVAAPQTLKELFGLLEFQESLNRPSKCGIEVRDYTPRLYGGYFYNWSVEEGQECWNKVNNGLAAAGYPMPVILKRACTEFEMVFGDSTKWQITDEQLQLEEDIYNAFELGDNFRELDQHPIVRPRIIRSWIQWAFKHGDKTYLDYTGGEPLYPDTVKYHDMDLSKLGTYQQEIVKPENING